MNGTKSLFASTGVWGGLISAAGGIATVLIGVDFSPAEIEAATNVANETIEAARDRNWAVLATSAVTIVSAFVSIRGRIRATKQIG